ncbi:MAG: hypothetical protein A2284_13795 [Deltaproteobacteria bacterium RIFOXYA12_FULL_61_11]|nr:MAG: hypothetical protein A2284_13795 [Deltaproteobacteria bacterium RIFOXYA12_FULL_61_11]
MPTIALFSASHCGGEELARGVATALGLPLLEGTLLDEAASLAGAPPKRYLRSLLGAPSFLNNLTHDREKSLAYLQLALAKRLQHDDFVFQGLGLHLIPPQLTHVLRVCLLADLDYRLQHLVASGLEAKEAQRRLSYDDEELARHIDLIHQRSPWDAELYDLRLPLHTTTPDEAIRLICEAALKEALKPTRASLAAALDFLLASEVKVELARHGHHDCDVEVQEGEVVLKINRNVLRLSALARELTDVAVKVPGVAKVRTEVGPRYNAPDILRNLEVPEQHKVLLVDDERDFVLTLSERLEMRNLASDVVYSGEEALAYLEERRPEVMVLDLRMPGMDGLEVLQRLRTTHPEVRVIILTGHGSEQDQQKAMELGAFAYLQKPVAIDQLVTVLQQASVAKPH